MRSMILTNQKRWAVGVIGPSPSAFQAHENHAPAFVTYVSNTVVLCWGEHSHVCGKEYLKQIQEGSPLREYNTLRAHASAQQRRPTIIHGNFPWEWDGVLMITTCLHCSVHVLNQWRVSMIWRYYCKFVLILCSRLCARVVFGAISVRSSDHHKLLHKGIDFLRYLGMQVKHSWHEGGDTGHHMSGTHKGSVWKRIHAWTCILTTHTHSHTHTFYVTLMNSTHLEISTKAWVCAYIHMHTHGHTHTTNMRMDVRWIQLRGLRIWAHACVHIL